MAFLLAGVLTAFPLASLLPEALGLPSRPFSIGARGLVLLVAIGVLLRWISGRRDVYAGPGWAVAGTVWVLLLLRMALDFGSAAVPFTLDPLDYVLIALGACLLPMIALFEKASSETSRAGWWLALVASSTAAAGLAIMFARGSLTQLWDARFSSETLNPIAVGYLGALITVLCVAKPEAIGHPPHWSVRAGLVLVRVLGFAGGAVLTVVSGSRGPLIALVIALAAYVFLTPHSAPGRSGGALRRYLATAATCVVSAVVIWWVVWVMEFNPFSRLVHVLEDTSTSYRAQALEGSLRQFNESPVFGDLLVERSTLDYPHNVLAESLMALGLPGFLALSFLMLLSLRAAFDVLRRGTAWAWIACVYLLQLFAALTSGSLYLSDGFWAFTAAVLASSRGSAFVPVWRASR